MRKLEEQFRAVLTRLVSRFIQPQLKKLEKKAAREAAQKHQQRLELAKKRIDNNATPANHPVSSDSKYAKFMFNDVLHEIEGAIPRTIGLDGQIRNPVIITAERLTINATQITEQSSRVPRVSRCSRPGSSLKMTLSKFFHQHRNRLIRDDDRRLSPIPGLENRETWGTLRDFCPRRGSRPSFGR